MQLGHLKVLAQHCGLFSSAINIITLLETFLSRLCDADKTAHGYVLTYLGTNVPSSGLER